MGIRRHLKYSTPTCSTEEQECDVENFIRMFSAFYLSQSSKCSHFFHEPKEKNISSYFIILIKKTSSNTIVISKLLPVSDKITSHLVHLLEPARRYLSNLTVSHHIPIRPKTYFTSKDEI
uniref:Uncharacterized protein MANES_08G093800 n=1 Tax=Rhizophora mucronata TaxID=61149 RepID=A0A2P2L043_RHIMU